MPSTRKRQTRLAFTPLPSSSPQATQLSTQLRPRGASVRYDGFQTPAKKRRVEGSESEPKLQSSGSHIENSFAIMRRSTTTPSPLKQSAGFAKRGHHLLPTPEASSQVLHGGPASDDDVDSTFSDSSLPSLKTALTNSTKSEHQYAPLNDVKAKSSGISGQAILGEDASPSLNHRKRSQTSNVVIVSSDDSSDDKILQHSSTKRVHGRSGRSDSTTQSPTQSRPITSLRVKPLHFILGGSTSSAAVRGSRKRNVVTPTSSKTIRSSMRRISSSDHRSPASKHSNHKAAAKPMSPTNNKRRSARLSTRAISPTVDESSPATEVEQVPRKAAQRAMSASSEDDSDVVLTGVRPRGRSAFQQEITVGTSEEEESDEDVIISPTKRKPLVRPGQPSSHKKVRRQEDEDLEEDLEILRDTELHQDRTRGRAVDSKKDAARKHLEKLKALRENRNIIESSHDSELPATSRRSVDDSDSFSQVSDELDSEADVTHQALRDNLDEYEEDFLDDEEDTVGVPLGLEDIPLEFTRHAHKKAKEHFKDAVEWMVHKKLNPAFARDDPVYRAAFRKLELEVKAYAGSKFISAVWTGDFARALKARPEFFEVEIPKSSIDYHHCDACNRTNHPAKYMITFGGKAYHPESLEKLADEDDNGDKDANFSDDDVKSRDALGDPLPGTDKEFFVGRFCKANATIAHSLLHWRFHLNEWVLDWLKNAGFTTPERIVERENWSIKKRSDYANKVVDEMEEKGEIKALYRDFKITLDEARDYKPERFR